MMIRRDEMPAKMWEAMLTPIHEVLPADEASHTGALFIGSIFACAEPTVLKDYNISQIVTVLDSSMQSYLALARAGGKAYKIPISDSTAVDLKPYLEGACSYIADNLNKGHNVLVHCQQGISRSAAIIVAYLMKEKGMCYDEAYGLVKSKRPCVKPNIGFERTLRDWEAELRHAKHD